MVGPVRASFGCEMVAVAAARFSRMFSRSNISCDNKVVGSMLYCCNIATHDVEEAGLPSFSCYLLSWFLFWRLSHSLVL